MTHKGSIKFELKCTWQDMLFCVRVNITQIIDLWNRKKNPSQCKLLTWLLFLKWVRAYVKPFYDAPERHKHPMFGPSRTAAKGLGKGQSRCMSRWHKRRNRIACACPLWKPLSHSFLPFIYTVLSFSYQIFCTSFSWRICCKRMVLHFFLGHKTLWKSAPNSALSPRKKSINSKPCRKFQKIHDRNPWSMILWNPGRPPMKMPPNVLQRHWAREKDGPSELL